MSTLRLLTIGLVVGMANTCGATPNDERTVPAGAIVECTIVGTWEVIKAEKGTGPVGDCLQFTRDGRAKHIPKGEEKGSEEVRYKVAGHKINFTTAQGNKATITIKTLTASNLVLADEQGKKVELKRKWK